MILTQIDNWLAKKLCQLRGHRWRSIPGMGCVWFCRCCKKNRYVEEGH